MVDIFHSNGAWAASTLLSKYEKLWSLLSLWPGWGGRGRVWGGGWWQYCQHYRPHVAISPEFRGRASDQWPVGGGWRVSVVLWPASHPHHLHPPTPLSLILILINSLRTILYFFKYNLLLFVAKLSNFQKDGKAYFPSDVCLIILWTLIKLKKTSLGKKFFFYNSFHQRGGITFFTAEILVELEAWWSLMMIMSRNFR